MGFNLIMFIPQPFPSLIKYMGSKAKIINFVINGLNVVHKENKAVLDLFSGSASLSGAIGLQQNFISNDIQCYSKILAKTYLESLKDILIPTGYEIIQKAQYITNINKKNITLPNINYSQKMTLVKFNELEALQKELIKFNFSYDFHLFTKNYSGTWWSYEQCMWIDAIRQVAEDYKDQTIYYFILSSLMYAMAYSSQGTGHYAQYRDAKTESTLKDICIYRKKSIPTLFERKFDEVCKNGKKRETSFTSHCTSFDYKDALNKFEGGTVYADPPYCSVHYSRFYHALETLILYDYPELQKKNNSLVKGRYRIDRHQSPFSIKSQTTNAFLHLLNGVKKTESSLVLSYSNTGMLDLELLIEMSKDIFINKNLEIMTTDYQHMTLGRKGKRYRDVKECLLLVQ